MGSGEHRFSIPLLPISNVLVSAGSICAFQQTVCIVAALQIHHQGNVPNRVSHKDPASKFIPVH